MEGRKEQKVCKLPIRFNSIPVPKEMFAAPSPSDIAAHPEMRKVVESVHNAINRYVKSIDLDPGSQLAKIYIANDIEVERRGSRTMYVRKRDGFIICQTELKFEPEYPVIVISSRYLTPEDADEQQTATGTPG